MARIRSARRRGKIPKNITQEHYVRCDNTGLRILSGDVRKQWDGLLVWKEQFDERNPQEFVRGVVDNFGVEDARPEAPDSVLLGSASVGETTDTDTLIVLGTVTLAAEKYVSYLNFTLTTASAIRNNLYVERSDNGVTWTRLDDPLMNLTVQAFVSGSQTSVPIGHNATRVRLVADFGVTSTEATWELAMNLRGGDAST